MQQQSIPRAIDEGFYIRPPEGGWPDVDPGFSIQPPPGGWPDIDPGFSLDEADFEKQLAPPLTQEDQIQAIINSGRGQIGPPNRFF